MRQQGQAHQCLELGREPSFLLEALLESLHQSGVLQGADDLGGGLENGLVAGTAPGRAACAQGKEAGRLVSAPQVDKEAGRKPLFGELPGQPAAVEQGPQALEGDDRAGSPKGGAEPRHVRVADDVEEFLAQPATGLDGGGALVAPRHDDADVGHRGFAQSLQGRFANFVAASRPPGRHGQGAESGRLRFEVGGGGDLLAHRKQARRLVVVVSQGCQRQVYNDMLAG